MDGNTSPPSYTTTAAGDPQPKALPRPETPLPSRSWTPRAGRPADPRPLQLVLPFQDPQRSLGRSLLMLLRRHLTAAALLAALLATTAACGGDDEPEATPSSSTTPTTQSPSPTVTTPTEPAWEDKYTDAQLDAYDAALARYESYETRTEPIWAEGKVTDRAEALFKQYFPSPIWQGYLSRLTTYEQVDVQIDGLADVYWSKAKSISDTGLSVVINQCVDYTTISTTQRGKPAQPVEWQQKPNLRTITLEKPDGYDWLIYGVVDASTGKARPCEP